MPDPQINGVLVPDTMKDAGVYQLLRNNRNIRNGVGVLVESKRAVAIWKFEAMNQEEYDWWIGLLGWNGGPGTVSAVLNSGSTIIWDETFDVNRMITFPYIVLDMPVVGRFMGNLYQAVTVNISGLVIP